MNIWILNHYASPPHDPGSTRHYDIGRALVKLGHQVTIFAAGFSHRARREEKLQGKQIYRVENIDGIEFLWIRTCPYYGGNNWRRVVNMLSYAVSVVPLGLWLKARPDVILASSPHPFAGLAGWLLAKLKRAKFVFEIRDLWPQTLVEIGGYSNKSPVVIILRFIEKFLYHRAKRIIFVPPYAWHYLQNIGINVDKLVHIPQVLGMELLSNTGSKLPEQIYKLVSGLKAQGNIMVGYAGAHGWANALETVIKAAKLVQEKNIHRIHFLLVGDGIEKPKLIEMAENFGLENISFLHPLPKYNIPAFLALMDIVIISRRKSNLGMYGTSLNKLVDGMASSKPIVWGTNSLNDPVAEANCGITVPPEDAEAMATAILKLCGLSQEERQMMGSRGYEYAMKHHQVSVLAERLLEALEKPQQC